MARSFDGQDNVNQLENLAATPVSRPFTMACWYYLTGIFGDNDFCPLQIQNQGATSNYDRISLGEVGNSNIHVFSGSASTKASTSTTGTADTWEHACASVASAADRKVYLNGGGEGTDTTNSSDSGFDSMSIGREGDSTPGDNMDGNLAEVAVWNIALSSSKDVPMLGKGFSPLFVRKDALVVYAPLVRGGDERSVVSDGYVFSESATAPGIADHPPIRYPMPPMVFGLGTVPAPATAIMNILQGPHVGADLYNGALM